MSPHDLSSYKNTSGIRHLYRATQYSIQGLKAAIQHEAAFRQELVLAVLLIPSAFWLGRSPLEIAFLILSVVLVLAVELLNTAIEALADALCPHTHPLIGRAKDLGSAAVFLMLGLTFIIWISFLVARFAP